MDINFISAKLGKKQRPNIARKLTRKINTNPILKYLLYVGVFLIPLWFLPFTADVLELNKSILLSFVAGAGLLLWLINLISGNKLKTRSKSVALAALVFVAVAVASTIMALSKDASLFGAAGSYSSSLISIVGAVGLFFLLVSTGVVDKKNLRHLIVGSAFIALLLGALQLIGLRVLPFDVANSSSFNSVGTFSALGIFGAVIFPLLFVLPKHKLTRVMYIATGALALFIVTTINWWVVWAPLLIGMAAMIVIKLREINWKRPALPVIVLAFGLVMTLISFNPLSGLKNSLPLEIAPSWQASYQILRDGLSNKPERLALGYGPESFKYIYDLHRPESISATLFSDISFVDGTSELVNTVAHFGFAGLLAIAFLIFMVVRMVKRNFNVTRDITILAAFIGASTAFVLYPLNITLMSTFWVILGLLVMTYGTDSAEIDLNKSDVYSAISSTVFTLVLVGVLAGLYFSSTTLAADVKFGKSLRKDTTVDSVNGMLEAIDLNSRNQTYSVVLSRTLLTAINDELNSDKPIEQINANVQRMMAVSIEVAKNATDRNPQNSQNWLNRGFIYENLLGFIDGAEVWAVSSYEEALTRRPNDPLIYTRIGRTYLGRANLLIGLFNRVGQSDPQAPQIGVEINANLAKAEENFKRATTINSFYGSALYNLGAVYERQGKLLEAAKQLATYQQVRPNDAGLAFELGLLSYRIGEKEFAFQQLQKAVQLFPDYSNAIWYLSLILEEQGELELSIAGLQRILELNPGNELVIDKIAELQAGISNIPPDKITDIEPLEQQ